MRVVVSVRIGENGIETSIDSKGNDQLMCRSVDSGMGGGVGLEGGEDRYVGREEGERSADPSKAPPVPEDGGEQTRNGRGGIGSVTWG